MHILNNGDKQKRWKRVAKKGEIKLKNEKI